MAQNAVTAGVARGHPLQRFQVRLSWDCMQEIPELLSQVQAPSGTWYELVRCVGCGRRYARVYGSRHDRTEHESVTSSQ